MRTLFLLDEGVLLIGGVVAAAGGGGSGDNALLGLAATLGADCVRVVRRGPRPAVDTALSVAEAAEVALAAAAVAVLVTAAALSSSAREPAGVSTDGVVPISPSSSKTMSSRRSV